MYHFWSYVPCIFHSYQVRVTIGNSGLCCCACVTSFRCWLTPLCVGLDCYILSPAGCIYVLYLCVCLCDGVGLSYLNLVERNLNRCTQATTAKMYLRKCLPWKKSAEGRLKEENKRMLLPSNRTWHSQSASWIHLWFTRQRLCRTLTVKMCSTSDSLAARNAASLSAGWGRPWQEVRI